MKKKSVLLIALACCLTLCGCTGDAAESPEPETLTGRALVFESGSCAILTDQEEVIVMADVSTAGNLFYGLYTGDRIAVTHGPIRETYPAQADIYTLECLGRGSAESIPAGTLDLLESMGWILTAGPFGEPATEPVLVAATEPYSGEIPTAPPGDTMPEAYFHLNGDRIEPLPEPDCVTVSTQHLELMDYDFAPIEIEPEQAAAIVRQINALKLEGYDMEQSTFMWPAGGGYLVRLYYGDQVVTFNFGTDWLISVQYPDDAQPRSFLDKSGNFEALIRLLYQPLLAAP